MKLSRFVLGFCALILAGGAVVVSAQEKQTSAPSQVSPGQEAKAAITGTVSDQAGAGVAAVTVTATNAAGQSATVVTDNQGLYALTDVSAGLNTVSVVLRGTKVFEANVVLSPAQVLTLSVAGAGVAQPGGNAKAAMTGTISDQTGTGVAAATVTATNATGQTTTVTTDNQGLYAVTDLPAGPYAVSVVIGGTKVFGGNLAFSPAQVVTLGIGGAAVAQTVEAAAMPGQAGAISSSTQSAPPATAPQAAQAAAEQAPPSAGTTPGGFGGPGIGGVVSDQTGAVLVGATVNVSKSGSVIQTAVSDEKGNYEIKGLPAGSYDITVTMAGFKPFDAPGVALAAGQSIPLDVALEPAGTKTEVVVEGQRVAEVETENAQVSGTITEKEVLSLGLNGRNFTQLIALTPGVSNQTGQDEAKVGVTGSVKYSVNGGRVEYNTFEVDGSDVLNAGLNGAESTLVVYPSLDAIQEVKVLTSNYGAMYGRTASGTVMVNTKSGGAKWHGDGYEFLRNEAFNARNYFDQTRKAPLYRRNDFGFTIGGPLYIPNFYNEKKDKTFVFWSQEFRYEKSPTDQQPDFNRGVPSLAERSGDFNDVCPAYNDPTSPAPGIFSRTRWPDCPSAGVSDQYFGYQVAFPNNNIGQLNGFGGLDPNALALLSTNLIPLPNSSSGCNSSIGSCYDAVISEPTYWREELGRLDHNFSPKLKATLRYIHDSWNTTVPIPQWQNLPGNSVNSFPTVQNKFVGPGVSVVAQLTQTITSTLLNVVSGSFTNSHITLDNVNGPGGANYQRPARLGQPGGACVSLPDGTTNCPMGAIFNNGFGGKAPGIIIAGNNLAYGGNGFTADTSYMPWEHTNPTYSFRDDVSKAIKNHTLQFGVQAIFSQKNETNSSTAAATADVQGLLTFSNINGGETNTGNAFANFLTQSTSFLNPNAIQSYTQDSTQYRYYNSYRIGEPYIQDDWRVNSRLTVNLGLRVSLFGLYHEKYLSAYNWEPAAYNPALAAQTLVDPTSGQLLSATDHTPIPINLGNVDPRILNGLVRCGATNVPEGCMTGHVFNPAPRIGFAWDPFGNGKTSIRAGYGIFFEHGTGEEANTGSLEASAPNVLSVTQRFPQNYGCIGGSGAGCTVQPGAYPLNVTSIPTRAVWPYAQQWSLSVQRELPKSMVATIAYVGSKGTHLTVERQLNQLKPLPSALNPFGIHEPFTPEAVISSTGLGDCGGFTGQPGAPGTFQLLNGTTIGPQDPAYINLEAACSGEPGKTFSNVIPNVNTLRPYQGLGEIFALQNVADSSYHALQATLRRTKGPLTVGASYSYSHSIDDSSDRSDSTFVNSYNLLSNRANSNFDQRHLLSVSYIYQLPLARFIRMLNNWNLADDSEPQSVAMPGDSGRVRHALVDGWELSGITVFQSGTPFSVINGGSSTISVLDNAGVANGVGAASYPDVVGNPHAHAPLGGNNSQSFGPILGNPDAFAAPRGLTFGDAGRNFMNNPNRLNFDMSLLKHFAIGESGSIEFRAEAFNIFNHTQFRIYDANLGNTGSNVISCYGGPNYTAGFASLGGADCLTGNSFLHPVDAHRPRTVQLGLKYIF